jgi:hypothetical protein
MIYRLLGTCPRSSTPLFYVYIDVLPIRICWVLSTVVIFTTAETYLSVRLARILLIEGLNC